MFCAFGAHLISIHAPREGGDRHILHSAEIDMIISIHAPREGGDSSSIIGLSSIKISIHAPREGGDHDAVPVLRHHLPFQSTPPARGATRTSTRERKKRMDFNPRPPRGGRLGLSVLHRCIDRISIHAPREGGDVYLPSGYLSDRVNFNPRPPRGGRRHLINFHIAISTFQSTPPARGATHNFFLVACHKTFQSTPPARGATADDAAD